MYSECSSRGRHRQPYGGTALYAGVHRYWVVHGDTVVYNKFQNAVVFELDGVILTFLRKYDVTTRGNIDKTEKQVREITHRNTNAKTSKEKYKYLNQFYSGVKIDRKFRQK